jgi:hypothetical protein
LGTSTGIEGESRCWFIKVTFMIIKEKRKFIECHLFGCGGEDGKMMKSTQQKNVNPYGIESYER